jgi:hypothetical protein
MSVDPLYQMDESAMALCPTLYNALRSRVPGGIILANQGESMVQQSTLDRQRGQYHTYVVHSGEYYRVNCPFCNDTRHRLWVNHMFGQPDANGQPMRFLVVCYNDNCLALLKTGSASATRSSVFVIFIIDSPLWILASR